MTPSLPNFIVRPATRADLEPVYQMAKRTGGGFTNLPPNRKSLAEKLDRAIACLANDADIPADERFFFVLEDLGDETTPGKGVRGTCQIFTRVGATWPFYSYRVGVLTQYSRELDRTFRAEMLGLCTDLDGASEVGGLFLHPAERASGIGKLLARSRYLFMKLHRGRFADKTLAELRGAQDETGSSPFWDGIAGRFFGMSFHEADEFNAIHGNQFIADLMPKHPVYVAMIPERARSVIGVPHTSGRAAMRMLEEEGFAYENYIDIFDGGPTMTVATDRIATIKAAREAEVVAVVDNPDDGPGEGFAPALLAHGRLAGFRACLGAVAPSEGGIALPAATARLLGVTSGQTVTWVPTGAPV